MGQDIQIPSGRQPLHRRYRAFSHFLKERFGGRVYRVTIDAGFTCPNVDGTVATGGCVYCDNRSFSPNRRLPRTSIRAQVERGIAILSKRYGAEMFLAYFQAATNTYAPVEKLRRLYDEALEHPQLVGLIVGTRPDCVPDDVLDLIEGYAAGPQMSAANPRDPNTQRAAHEGSGTTAHEVSGTTASHRYVCLELGLQSMHNRSLDWMNRGHHLDSFLDAVERCRGRSFDVCVHVILGLPGESHDDMMAAADLLASLPVHAIKIHNLHVVKDTPLEKMYRLGQVRMFGFEEYVALACDFLERLPPTMIIHRLSGDAPP